VRKATAIVVVLALTVPTINTALAANPVLGAKCGPLGNMYGSGTKKLVCALKNKKMVWIKAPIQTTNKQPTPNSQVNSASPINTYPQNQPSKSNQQNQQGPVDPYVDLPLLSTFAKNLSSAFPVDFSKALLTIPYLGVNSKAPHAGLHVHWTNANGDWTNAGGKDHVTNYPVVRAFEDGFIDLVTNLYTMQTTNGQGHQRYGVVLAFARTASGRPVMADYSLEPLINEPSPHFYESFIKVHKGQKVKKGDIIAYLYVPPTSTGGTHLHFNLISDNQQMTPSVFTPEIVKSFASKYLDASYLNSGAILSACIGYGIGASENPFEKKAVDCL
jgi:hypothetical protein